MKEDKWLSKFIIETGLINRSFLSETESYALQQYLNNPSSIKNISTELELSDTRLRQIIDNAFGKILLTIRDYNLKTARLDELLNENNLLKTELLNLTNRFNKEVETKSDYESPNTSNIPVTEMRLSVRALNALNNLQIKTLGELATKSMNDLLAYKNNGVKTINEIINRAEEFGIKIK